MSIQSQIDRIIGEVSTQSNLIAQIKSVVDSLPEAGTGSEPELQEKTVSPTTSSQTVTPDSGYDGLSKVTINAMPTATQATPSITVSSSGLITASATQTAGYVSAGTKSSTKQLTTQAAKTITPTKSSQTAVSKGVYTTGAVTVAAIPSQYITTTDATATSSDIRSGKTAYVDGTKVTGSIADFDGSYTCSGDSTGGGSDASEIYTVTVDMTEVLSDPLSMRIVYVGPNGYVNAPFDPSSVQQFSVQKGILFLYDQLSSGQLGGLDGGNGVPGNDFFLFEIQNDCTIIIGATETLPDIPWV